MWEGEVELLSLVALIPYADSTNEISQNWSHGLYLLQYFNIVVFVDYHSYSSGLWMGFFIKICMTLFAIPRLLQNCPSLLLKYRLQLIRSALHRQSEGR